VALRTLSLIAVAGASLTALAQDGPISTDRGTSYSSSPLIVATGRWQIEAGYTYNRVGSAKSESLGEILVRYPVSSRWEVRLGNVGFARIPGDSGFVDPTLGFKVKLRDSGNGAPDVALIAQTTVPAGARAFRVDRSQVSVFVPWYLAIDGLTGVGGQFGYSDLGPSGARFSQYSGGIYLARTLNPTTTGYLELYGLAPLSKGGPNGAFVDIAVGHLLNPNTQIDFRIGTGLNQSRDGWLVGAGVAFRL
jgi:hypothetical protein